MSTIPEIKSEKTEMTSLRNQVTLNEKLGVKNIIFKMQDVVTDPIDPNHISKMSTNGLSVSSVVKAGVVFVGTVGAYYLAKTTGILSYFGWGAKNSDSKDVGNNEIIEVKTKANALSVRTNLETARQANGPSTNRITETYKDEDRTVKFEDRKI
jgi:hypothetical protein